jgi:phage host-nuclease inhibitor protein Gam
MSPKKKTTRLKQPAVTHTSPTTNDECATYINQIGVFARQISVLQAAMNDEIAVITDSYTGQFSPLQDQLKNLQQGVQLYCEANRDDLTHEGKTKTATFITGSVQWRQRPPSVGVRGADSVIEALKNFNLHRFIRIKEEINKDAILNEPAAVAGVAGITLSTGKEDFVITPFEQEAV